MGISAHDFQQMQQRVSGRSRPQPLLGSSLAAEKRVSLILGIDPSLRGTGYGMIRLARPRPELVAQGTIRCPAGWERSRCLLLIAQTLRDLLKRQVPDVCVVEGIFYAQNLQTAILMGEARGASLVAVAETGVPIYEMATRRVKQAVVGYGAAQKDAVAKMVQRMLGLAEQPEPDAADALALALAHAQENGRYMLKPQKKL
jgi:crossover junction endodeoxyribonuclease RuvC